MTDNQIEVVEETVVEDSGSLLDSLRRILLAGVGVVSLAQEEIENFLGKLVERGEIAEKDARKLMTDVMDGRRKAADERRQRAVGEVDSRIDGVMSRLNMPSRSEIDNLSKQIAELSAKVDQLTQEEQ